MSSRITDTDRYIASRLRELRAAAKLTQPQVAGSLGITYQSYQKMEGGKHSFRLTTIDKLSQIFDVPIQDFLAAPSEDLKRGMDAELLHGITLLRTLPPERRGEAVSALLNIKHGVA